MRNLQKWRIGWDSNPRYGCPYTRVPGVRLRPLGHLSSQQADALYPAIPEVQGEKSEKLRYCENFLPESKISFDAQALVPNTQLEAWQLLNGPKTIK